MVFVVSFEHFMTFRRTVSGPIVGTVGIAAFLDFSRLYNRLQETVHQVRPAIGIPAANVLKARTRRDSAIPAIPFQPFHSSHFGHCGLFRTLQTGVHRVRAADNRRTGIRHPIPHPPAQRYIHPAPPPTHTHTNAGTQVASESRRPLCKPAEL